MIAYNYQLKQKNRQPGMDGVTLMLRHMETVPISNVTPYAVI